MYGRDDIRIEFAICTSDHDDTNASSPAELNGARDFFTRRIQHTNTPNEGQVSLRDSTGIKGKEIEHISMFYIYIYIF